MESASFQRFRFSFFEDPHSPRDGLDEASLEQLVGAERLRAEAMLLNLLPDTRAVIGLGVLRSKVAEPAMLRLLDEARRSESRQRTYVAIALWRIGRAQIAVATLIEVLARSGEPFERLDAAIALRRVRTPVAVAALLAALDDDEALVRHHAAVSLLRMHGLTPGEAGDAEVYRIMSDDAAHRAGGADAVRDAIAGKTLDAGAGDQA